MPTMAPAVVNRWTAHAQRTCRAVAQITGESATVTSQNYYPSIDNRCDGP